MAKVTPKKLDPKDGKWVTINGNHIFIKTGQTVQQALNETVGHHKAAYEKQSQEKRHAKASKRLKDMMSESNWKNDGPKGEWTFSKKHSKRIFVRDGESEESAMRSYEKYRAEEKAQQKKGEQAQRDYYESLSPKDSKEQLQKDVWSTMTSYWHEHSGMPDRKSSSFVKALTQKGYTEKEILDEFERQMDEHLATFGWVRDNYFQDGYHAGYLGIRNKKR